MYHWDNFEHFKLYIKSREKTANNLYERFTRFLKDGEDLQKMVENRIVSLDFLMIKLNCIPKDMAEITFNLYHVAFLLESELRKQIDTPEDHSSDENLKILLENYYDYFLFTSLFISAKFCGNSNFFKKVKELIIDSNYHFNTIILCEVLFLNYTEWNLPLFSPSEFIYGIFSHLQLPEGVIRDLEVAGMIDNYINYALSEYLIYTTYDQFIISLAICRLLLKSVNETGSSGIDYSDNFEGLLSDCISSIDKVNGCAVLIWRLLNVSDEEEAEEGIISENPDSQATPFVF